jgi:hypothetical protein
MKHQRTLEELLLKDLWPHLTERLERALDWLQQHGRTPADPSGPQVPYGWYPRDRTCS